MPDHELHEEERWSTRSELQSSPAGRLNASISRAVVGVSRAYLGRGPTRAQAFFRRNVVVVMLEDTQTPAERALVADGNGQAVLDMRTQMRQVMSADLVRWVERLTGGRVAAVLGATHISPDLETEIFVMEQVVQTA